jgi:hypothetical protein
MMKKQILFLVTALIVEITVHSAEVAKWPKWNAADANAVNTFIEFYNKDLKNISVSLKVSNGTKETVMFESRQLESGTTEIIKPVSLSREPLKSGAVFKITTPSGSNLGVFAINIESRGWPISRFPLSYEDPKTVKEKVTATLLLAGSKGEAYTYREFDIYQLKKAIVDIHLSLRGSELVDSNVAMSVDSE